MTTAHIDVVELVKTQKQKETDKFMAETRALRKRITQATGKWDSVEILRRFRYAHK